MKTKTILVILICIAFFTAAYSHAAEKQSASGPKAVFPDKFFEFPPVIEGADVQHDFVVQNSGSEMLEILDVRTG